MAQKLAQQTDPFLLETLAAAHAELGQFDEAVKWQEKALAMPDYPKEDRTDGEEMLRLFKAKQPYRDTGGCP